MRTTFDRIGNMRNVQRHGTFTAPPAGVEQVQWYYGYGFGTSRLTQVLAFATSALPARSYQYDPAGNITKDNYRGHRTTYGRSHLPMSVALGATARVAGYHYNAADQRVYKSLAEESGTNEPGTLLTETFYLRDAAGRELGVLEGTGEDESGTWTWYAFGGQRFAQLTPIEEQQPEPNGAQSGGEPFNYINPYGDNSLKDVGYYVHDHLGNTRVLYTVGCNGEGNTRSFVLENAVDYYPYGSVLREYLNERAARYLTTMHERDAETALDYRGARYYDSDVARFLSLDPAQAEYPGWSSYAYVMGNPVSLVDPRGSRTDNYSVDEQGNVRLIEKTKDSFDVLVGRTASGDIETTIIRDQTILPQLAKGPTKTGSGTDERRNNVAQSRDGMAASEAFVFLATHSKVEWGYHVYAESDKSRTSLLVTSHMQREAASGDLYCDPSQQLFDIHSHVGPPGEVFDPATLGASWTGDTKRANSRTRDYDTWGKRQPGYAVFHAPSQHLHTYTPFERPSDLGRVNSGIDLFNRTR